MAAQIGHQVDERQQGGRRWRRRAVGVLAVAVACVVAVPTAAAAAPRSPSDTQVAAAQQAKADAAARLGAISAELAQARADADAAHQAALIALQDYEEKQAAYEAARAAADAATAAAAQAAADLEQGRSEVAAFARASYMRGTTTPGITALLSSGGVAELVERAALLDAAGAHRSDVVTTLAALEVQAQAADRTAQEAAGQAEALQVEATQLLAQAQSQESSARSQVDAIAVREVEVAGEVRQAEETLYGLEGARAAAAQQAAAPAPQQAAPRPSAPNRPPSGPPAGAPSGSAVQTAIAAARSQLGVAYSWGGGGSNGPSYGIAPDTQVYGFDCSGLTQYAYAQAGISIGGTSRDQWWLNRSRQVAVSALQPGDLLFWGGDRSDYTSITHVAIYLGNGQMIEAPDRGQDVQIASARTSSSTYFGAVRPSA